MRTALATLAVACLALCDTAAAALANPAKEGAIDAYQCGHGPAYTNAISNQALAGVYSVTVTVVTKDPGSLYYNVSGMCSGAWQQIGEEYTAMGSCDYVDLDGDHFFGISTGKGTGGDFRVYAGTGKYVGLEQTGHYESLGQYYQVPGENRSCVKFHGHWKMK